MVPIRRLNRLASFGYVALTAALICSVCSSLVQAKSYSHHAVNASPGAVVSPSVIRLDKLEPGLIPLISTTEKVSHPENKASHETANAPASEQEKAKIPSTPITPEQAKKDEQLNLDRWADAMKMGLSLAILTAMAMYASDLIQQRPRADVSGARTKTLASMVVFTVATVVAYLFATYWHGGSAARSNNGPRHWVALESDAYHFEVLMPQPVSLQRERVHEFWKNTIKHDDDDRNCMQLTYEQNEESMKLDDGPKHAFDEPKAAFDPRVSAKNAAQKWVDLYRANITSHKTVSVPGMAVGLDVEGQISEGWSFHVLSYASESGQSYVAVVSGATPFVNSPDSRKFLSSLHFKQN